MAWDACGVRANSSASSQPLFACFLFPSLFSYVRTSSEQRHVLCHLPNLPAHDQYHHPAPSPDRCMHKNDILLNTLLHIYLLLINVEKNKGLGIDCYIAIMHGAGDKTRSVSFHSLIGALAHRDDD
jgi:hypothetical protein